jgi:hypothetical protein
MNEHDVGRAGHKRLKPCAYGCLAGRTARDRLKDIHATCQPANKVDVVRSYDGLHEGDIRGLCESRQGTFEQRFACNSPELFGYFATCAQTLTGGHHDGCNLRHAFCSLVIMPLARSCGGGNALTAGVTPETNRIFALQHLHCEVNWLNYEHRKGTA